VGCGDGRTTARLALSLPNMVFSGFDYSSAMVENARSHLRTKGLSNVNFYQADICSELKGCFSLIYTTRCLINLPSWDLQKVAIDNIYKCLNIGGFYLMIENFIEGQDCFNQTRKNFGLPEIPIRSHNFFSREVAFLIIFPADSRSKRRLIYLVPIT
jgi:ubiquinone/menaquinone biosynthesis C-methylase UbiE